MNKLWNKQVLVNFEAFSSSKFTKLSSKCSSFGLFTQLSGHTSMTADPMHHAEPNCDRVHRFNDPTRHILAHQVVTNLPLTSKSKFCFGLARPGQAKMECLFPSQREFHHNLMCHPVQNLVTDSLWLHRMHGMTDFSVGHDGFKDTGWSR